MKPQPSPQPAAPGVVRFYNFLPPGNNFLEEVLAGLARPQKSIPPKYFYDEQGCRLFEAICELPEYYLTRAETAILRTYIAEITQFIGPDAQLIEFGSGAQAKTRILIEALQTLLYVPVDIAEDTLRASSGELARLFPLLNVVGICADEQKKDDAIIVAQTNSAPIKPAPITAVDIDDKFWTPRLEIIRTVTIPAALDWCAGALLCRNPSPGSRC